MISIDRLDYVGDSIWIDEVAQGYDLLLLVVMGHDKKRITIVSCERFEPLHRVSSHQPSNVSIAGVV